MKKASGQSKSPVNPSAGPRASATNGVGILIDGLRSNLLSMVTPAMKPQKEAPVQQSILTRALNAFDFYSESLTTAQALKFKRSLRLPDAAEMFLQFNDEERQEQIQDILENN